MFELRRRETSGQTSVARASKKGSLFSSKGGLGVRNLKKRDSLLSIKFTFCRLLSLKTTRVFKISVTVSLRDFENSVTRSLVNIWGLLNGVYSCWAEEGVKVIEFIDH